MQATTAPLAPPSPHVEGLTREVHRIAHSAPIHAALTQLLTFKPTIGLTAPLHRSRPNFSLSFSSVYKEDELERRPPLVLSALATILAQSFRLNKYSALKKRFWKTILVSKMMARNNEFDNFSVDGIDQHLWMVEDESFPACTIKLHHNKPMTETHLDAIAQFFTTPPEHEMNDAVLHKCAVFAPNEIRIGLAFTHYFSHVKLTPAHLHLIERMLDRVYASSTRQFVVGKLDMSDSEMDAAQLAALAGILEKNRAIYQIEHVPLKRIVDQKPSA